MRIVERKVERGNMFGKIKELERKIEGLNNKIYALENAVKISRLPEIPKNTWMYYLPAARNYSLNIVVDEILDHLGLDLDEIPATQKRVNLIKKERRNHGRKEESKEES